VSTVLATGAVKPQVGAEVRVGSRISGKVERLHANIGDVVKKGQVIAELEKADLSAATAQREAELRTVKARLSAAKALLPKETEKAQAEVARCQATLALARKELGREDALLRQGFSTQETRDRAQERSSVAEAQLTGARKVLEVTRTRYSEDVTRLLAEVERAEAALVYAKVQLSYATIKAPISGVIASVSTQQGETVAAGLSAPTFVTIIDLNRLQVDAYVDEVDIGKVRPGQGAVFTVDAFPSKEFKGKITAIYPKAIIQDNVVNYDVVIEITTPYHRLLRPEMTASVTVLLESGEGVLTVPGRAVKRVGGKSVVYVLAGGSREARDVKIGRKDGRWVEVLAGLQEGESVLLDVADTGGRNRGVRP
jgi:macrolide-specific efflux system membrane fusion protein